MAKRLKVCMLPSTYAPGVKPAAALAMALKAKDQPPAPAAEAAHVDQAPKPTLQPERAAG